MSIKEQCKYVIADMYNHGLTKTAMCGNCVNSVEDVYHYFFQCAKYESCTVTLFSSHKKYHN